MTAEADTPPVFSPDVAQRLRVAIPQMSPANVTFVTQQLALLPLNKQEKATFDTAIASANQDSVASVQAAV